MHVNEIEIHVHHVRHHKVSSCLSTKTKKIVSNMKYMKMSKGPFSFCEVVGVCKGGGGGGGGHPK